MRTWGWAAMGWLACGSVDSVNDTDAPEFGSESPPEELVPDAEDPGPPPATIWADGDPFVAPHPSLTGEFWVYVGEEVYTVADVRLVEVSRTDDGSTVAIFADLVAPAPELTEVTLRFEWPMLEGPGEQRCSNEGVVMSFQEGTGAVLLAHLGLGNAGCHLVFDEVGLQGRPLYHRGQFRGVLVSPDGEGPTREVFGGFDLRATI